LIKTSHGLPIPYFDWRKRMNFKNAYVVDALRTPFGSFGGVLSEIEAPQLAAIVIKELLKKTDIPPDAVNDVIIGQVLSGGTRQGPARQAMRSAGIPDSVHALTINKLCGSGLKAIMLGYDSIRLGESDLVIAGGMENMSLAPYLLKKGRYGFRMGHGEVYDSMLYDALLDPDTDKHMGVIGEESAGRNNISRQEQDAFAARSYELAKTAIAAGVLNDEIVPVVKQTRKGTETVSTDEEPFRCDINKIAQLKPVFRKDGTITAANASTINDGAALALLCSEEGLDKYNLKPKARIVAAATESLHPDFFPEAPVGAIEKVCAKAGLDVSEIDLFEINEAFAAVTLLAVTKLNIPLGKVNVNGGACAIGHPIGASGGRLAATLVRELGKRQLKYGLATLCIGGGEAVAVIFERV
jgi:acetyl-CoA C-acetyltransferase